MDFDTKAVKPDLDKGIPTQHQQIRTSKNEFRSKSGPQQMDFDTTSVISDLDKWMSTQN